MPTDMEPESPKQHLSEISTMWTILAQAHAHKGEGQSKEAQVRILKRYGSAIYRYLMISLRDADAADEIYQEFALRFIRGDFQNAHPSRGKFRNFLKTSLIHLMIDHRRRKSRNFAEMPSDAPEPAVEDESKLDSERQFLNVWRGEILARAWRALAEHDRKTNQHFYTVLRFRTQHPEMRSAQMAEELGRALSRTLNAEWVRKRLFLAREKFTDLLLNEVGRSLERPSLDEIEQELIDLELLEHCRPALERRRRDRL